MEYRIPPSDKACRLADDFIEICKDRGLPEPEVGHLHSGGIFVSWIPNGSNFFASVHFINHQEQINSLVYKEFEEWSMNEVDVLEKVYTHLVAFWQGPKIVL